MAATLERDFYPFTAIVGEEKMKLALVANAINPSIAGVLIRGERGTGKSTAVRALARLLPEHRVVEGCHFGDDPDEPEHYCIECRQRADLGQLPLSTRPMRVVELPINASEDRVVGSIDLESALRHGHRRFEPGVLAEANRNILYVDEVNLLDDHIVDVVLDAAAMGVNSVEREGVSFSHPSRFILVGTMNPEEGELRPQLLDRFGLCVDVEGIRDPDERVLIAERDADFKRGDHEFVNEFAAADGNLSRALAEAIAAFKQVRITSGQARLISSICVEADVLGHRADVVIDHAARALAAYRRHTSPSRGDIYDAATLALAHRARQPVRRDQDENRQPQTGEDDEAVDQSESEPGEPQASDTESGAEATAEETASSAEGGQQSSRSAQGMAAAKRGILSLLQEGDVRRERVAVGIMKNRTAEVVLRPTSSVSLARRRLEKLSVGGTTPLTHGLMAGYKVVKTELLRDPTVRPLLVLISDGRGNISMFKEEPLVEAHKVAALIDSENIDALVIDSARDYSHLPSVQHLAKVAPMYQTYAINACADLAERMGARYYGLYDLSRDEIASAVERELGRSGR